MKRAVWKTHSLFRFTTVTYFLLLICTITYMDPSESTGAVSGKCIYEESRLFTSELDNIIGYFIFGNLGLGHVFVISACYYDSLLWLGILWYHLMFLSPIFVTIGEAMSGYVENCFDLFSLYIVAHIGMAIGLFNLHILFIYTHRGITFYQWIPLKIRELYQSLIDKNKHQKDHLMQKIFEIEYKKRNSEKISLLEEDHEEFEQLIEKTCVEG